MSKFNIEKIACPRCSKESDFRVWSSINTALDPEMKKQVRTREAFKFVCPFCGADANVDYGFLYHQMEDQIIFYYTEQDGGYGIQFMSEGQGVATASFDKEMYQEIVDEFSSKIQNALEDDIVIDTDWALQKMK